MLETKQATDISSISKPPASEETRSVKIEAPRPLDAPPMVRRRGRPSKGEGSPPPRKIVERQIVGEVEFRKPASEIVNIHAAFERAFKEEQAIHARKLALAEQYKSEYGKTLKFAEPMHALDAKSPQERISSAHGRALAAGLYAAPAALLGVESRPKDDQLSMLGEAIADLSKYYSFDSEVMAWAGLGFAALACFTPLAMELRAKKAGTWDTDREKMRVAGFVAPLVDK